MKKLISLLLALAILLSLCACGSKKNEPNPDNSSDIANITNSSTASTPPETESVSIESNSAPAATSDDSIEERITADIDATTANLNAELESLTAIVYDYDTYVANTTQIQAFYEQIYTATEALCIRMCQYSIEYAESILNSDLTTDEMYDETDGIYDLIYEDAFDEIYDSIYEDLIDDIYDAFYDGALADRPDGVEYSEWSDIRSNEYDIRSDVRSEIYDCRSDARSNVYDFRSDLRSELYNDDIDGAWEIIEEFRADLLKASSVIVETEVADTPYEIIEAEISTDIEATIATLDSELESMTAKVYDYSTYMENIDQVEAFYALIDTTAEALCVRMCQYSAKYAEAVLNSGLSSDEMYNDIDNLYDFIYEDSFDEIYEGIYDGFMDDVYDAFYNGALEDYPNEVDYSDWFDVYSNEYDMWLDTLSDIYDCWYDNMSQIYSFWLDLRSELLYDDIDGAWDKLETFREDIEEMSS